jgi:hypothetical protein
MNAMKSLYVDDEPMNLMLFELNFGNDYLIFTADSGTTGLIYWIQIRKSPLYSATCGCPE